MRLWTWTRFHRLVNRLFVRNLDKVIERDAKPHLATNAVVNQDTGCLTLAHAAAVSDALDRTREEKAVRALTDPPAVPPFPEACETDRLLTQIKKSIAEYPQPFPPVRLLPVVIIRAPAPTDLYDVVSSLKATIKQRDGSPFPLAVQKATVNIDWMTGAPVTVDITAAGGFAVEAAAGLRSIEIDGRKYRLVEVPNVHLATGFDAEEIDR
jgi:hypothetical protein